jgi:hypothetical protein
VCHLHEVDTRDVEQDMRTFLADKLPLLKDEEAIAELARRAGGLFIYAATAVRFLSTSPPLSGSEQRSELKSLLSSWPKPAEGEEGLLVDTLYEQILASTLRTVREPHRRKRLDILHTILCAETRVSSSVLAELLSISLDTVNAVVESLHAVLYVSTKDNCVYWYHASFQDFVFDSDRSRFAVTTDKSTTTTLDVFCDPPSRHAHLANECFRVMQNLRFNICNLPSSFLFDSQVENMEQRVQKNITEALQYSSQYWARHLVQASDDNTEDLDNSLHDFLMKRFLFWIEVMNLIGCRACCDSLLRDSLQWLLKV